MFHTLRCKLVGMSFANPSIAPQVNDVVKLKLEPENPHDHHAIMVLNSRDEKIGYIGTDNTVSAGNRKNGCLTNLDIKPLIDFDDDDSYLAVITKEKGYFGFLDITIDDI